MDSSVSSIEDEHVESQLHNAERAYQEALHKTDLIIKDEDARRLRLKILLLENENDDLHQQLGSADDRIDALEQEGDEVRTELDSTRDDLQRQETESRIQARELSIMKTELSAMNGVSMDSTKALTEKLALARELATLKPELEHLRSQAAFQQSVLSEKLALQRQVNTLEVELETEKRATKRISEKSKNKDRELELQHKVEELQKELAREKREKEKLRKEAEKGLTSSKLSNRSIGIGACDNDGHAELQQKLDDERRQNEKARGQLQERLDDSEARSTLLEGKVDHIRTKLRVAKEELKECQAELEEARTGAPRGPSTVRKGESLLLSKSTRKRPATEMSTDVTIGTPDGTIRGKKRSRMDQTSRPGEKTSRPGEKSNFSITPYLNRTVSKIKLPLVHESGEDAAEITSGTATGSLDDSHLEDDSSSLLIDENSPSRYKSKPKATIPEDQSAEKKALVEAGPAVTNKSHEPSFSRSLNLLQMVIEDDGGENEELDVASTGNSIEREVVTTSKVPVKDADAAGPKKKKRKLLNGGKTIFDEVEASATKRQVSLTRPRSAGRGMVAGNKGIGAFGSIGGFGTFSPLKKEKKTFGGSVLA